MNTTLDVNSRAIIVSKYVALESLDENWATVIHTRTAARLKLTRALYDVLLKFLHPRSITDVFGSTANDVLLKKLNVLIAKGYLRYENVPERPTQLRERSAVAFTLFNCPKYTPPANPPDVTVIGVPYDLSNANSAGCRSGPTAIRSRSLDFDYRLDLQTGRPRGWFDAYQERRILEGITIADYGDVYIEYGESQIDFFERVDRIVEQILALRSFPLAIGGDHAVTFPIVKRLQMSQKIAVLQLDAHTHFNPAIPESIVNVASVGRHMRMLSQVEALVQVGHRGFTINPKIDQPLEKVKIISMSAYRKHGVQHVVNALPVDIPVYITIDMCALDPACVPAATHIVPGGFELAEIKTILYAVGGNRRILGLDIVGMDPARDVGAISSIVACHILLAALGAAMMYRNDHLSQVCA